MSRPNKKHRKKTPRASKAVSHRRAAPGRKKRRKIAGWNRRARRPVRCRAALRRKTKPPPRRGLPRAIAGNGPAVSSVASAGAANGPPPALVHPVAEVPARSHFLPPQSTRARRGPNGNGYHTKYFIEIYGSLKPDGSHLLIIENKTRIKIDWLQFILLLILASHARAKAGLDSPIDIRGGDYLQPVRVAQIIGELKTGTLLCGGRNLPEFNNAFSPELIHNAKYDLRFKVQQRGRNPSLLDAGDGAGYRISTCPGRIKITLVDPVGDLVFDWVE